MQRIKQFSEQEIIAQQKNEALDIFAKEIKRLKNIARDEFDAELVNAKIAAYNLLIGEILSADPNRPLSAILREDSPEMNKPVVIAKRNRRYHLDLPNGQYQATIQEVLHFNRGFGLTDATSKKILDEMRDRLFYQNPNNALRSNPSGIMADYPVFPGHQVLAKLDRDKNQYVENGRSTHLADFNRLITTIETILRNQPQLPINHFIDLIQEAFLKEARHYKKPLGEFIQRLHTPSEDYQYPRMLMQHLKSLYKCCPTYPNKIKFCETPTISKKRKNITRAAFSGGGAKGVTLGGGHQAMASADILKKLEHVSGASAGALAAASIAAGIEPIDFRQLLLTTNLKSLTGKSVWKLESGVVPGFTGDGEPLLELLRNTIRNSIEKALSKLIFQQQEAGKREHIRALKEKIVKADKITFAHLAQLTTEFPHIFKQLTILAVRFPDGTPQPFNALETPDIEVALAARASSALPLFFAPVEITVNGVTHKYNDGGQYDNLPTEYFDKVDGEYTNVKPEETIVFAFGEGLDNRKSPVHQAIHGTAHHLDMKTLRILDLAVNEKIVNILNDKTQTINTLNHELLKNVRKITFANVAKDQARKIYAHIENAINSAYFWNDLKLKENGHLTSQFKNYIHEKITPSLYRPGFISRLGRNGVVKVVGGFKGDYRNTDQKEIGYQRLRDFYRDGTIELRSGKIKTAHFSKATKHARIMDALGYLDTMFYVTTQKAHADEFDPNVLYRNLLSHFETIYKATLAGAGINIEKDDLIKKISLIKATNNSLKNDLAIYRVIKNLVERNLDSPAAFALSRTVEYLNEIIGYDQLCKETYQESFRRSGLFSMSNIAASSIFRNSALKSYLAENDDFVMDDSIDKNTRRGKIYQHLRHIDPRLFPENLNVVPAPAAVARL